MLNMNPLTQDQLKEMTGKWVKIVLLDESGTELYAFITKNVLNVFLGYDSDKYCVRSYFTFDECGKEFEAYSLEEKHIDREKWEPCEVCRGAEFIYGFADATTRYDWGTFSEQKVDGYFKHCPECGRPLTDEAWKELEKRLMEISK